MIDGVGCRVDSEGKRVVVGTGLVSNDERDTFTLKRNGGTLEEQVRSRPKFANLVSLAAGATTNTAGAKDGTRPPRPSSRTIQQIRTNLGSAWCPSVDELPGNGTTSASSVASAEPASAGLFGDISETMADVGAAGCFASGHRRSSRTRSITSMLDPAAEHRPGELFRLEGSCLQPVPSAQNR